MTWEEVKEAFAKSRLSGIEPAARPIMGEPIPLMSAESAAGQIGTALTIPPIVTGDNMADAETLQTLRASGGFTLPTELKQYLPLLLLFVLFVLLVFKR